MKKLIAILVAAALLFGCLPVAASAESVPIVSVEVQAKAIVGQIVPVTIYIENAKGLTSGSFQIAYNTSVFNFEDSDYITYDYEGVLIDAGEGWTYDTLQCVFSCARSPFPSDERTPLVTFFLVSRTVGGSNFSLSECLLTKGLTPEEVTAQINVQQNQVVANDAIEIVLDSAPPEIFENIILLLNASNVSELLDYLGMPGAPVRDKNGKPLGNETAILSSCTVYFTVDGESFQSCALIRMGDADGDGKITAADARKALRFSAKLETGTTLQYGTCDVDLDDKITASDARTILRVSAKLTMFT
ncbi:MAG: hypothetical protein LBS36_07920 [Oscillospiraceae bacterium]|jgi:hypothetical protein|nr:hypothetical protein [Oscillospiraceae bacterium]